MRLRIGYVPLTDAAALVAAVARGFAAREGLEIELSREVSWATVRDKLALGRLDAAHLLSPLTLAVAAGLSGPQAALVVPFALSLNGNAVTVSRALWAELEARGADGTLGPTAHAFAAVARSRRTSGAPLRLATVFPFSSHTEQLALLAEAGGLTLQEAAEVLVVPPPLMVDAMRAGRIDGFCVGSPWNSVAVAAGIGRIALLGTDIMRDTPEKVLALRRELSGDPATAALLRALQAAADWCADPDSHEELASLLGAADVLDLDRALVRRSLDGRLRIDPDGRERVDPHYIVLGGASCRPNPAHEAWIRDRLRAGGRSLDIPPVYRPDLYDAALP